MSDHEVISQFKESVNLAKSQSFTQSICSSVYFFYVISYFGRIFNNKGYQLAWYLLEHPEIIRDPAILDN